LVSSSPNAQEPPAPRPRIAPRPRSFLAAHRAPLCSVARTSSPAVARAVRAEASASRPRETTQNSAGMPAASTNVRTCCRPRFAPPVSEGSWHACIAAPRPRDDQRARRADEGSRGRSAARLRPAASTRSGRAPEAPSPLLRPTGAHETRGPHANAAAGRPPSHAPDPLCVFFWDQDKGGEQREWIMEKGERVGARASTAHREQARAREVALPPCSNAQEAKDEQAILHVGFVGGIILMVLSQDPKTPTRKRW